MSQPFVGEIRAFAFQFAPYGGAFCNGQSVSISQQETLYAVTGTIYGGDGVQTFNLPNLQGYVPMHWGNGSGGFNTAIGQVQGAPNVTLTIAQTPAHAHAVTADQIGSGGVPEKTPSPNANSFLAVANPDAAWNDSPSINVAFASNAISTVGGSEPHENRQPYLAVNFCISLGGVFPSRN
jgi:microcystin-dependent protein